MHQKDNKQIWHFHGRIQESIWFQKPSIRFMEKEGSSLKTHQSTLDNNFGCFYGSEIQIDNYQIN